MIAKPFTDVPQQRLTLLVHHDVDPLMVDPNAPTPPTSSPLIRAGLHTGECEVMDSKVGGMAVHIGARVAKEAEPGEVLVSSTVKDLVAGSGLRFRERGQQR